MILEYGGLTVLSEIQKELPNENIVYLGDTYNFPYGSKEREEIVKYSIQNVEFLISQNVKIIAVACGTATSQALDELKQKYNIPIVGIIEPTISYIKELNVDKIGVIATVGTIKNGAWERELKKVLPNIQVINEACPMLAEIAEEGKAKSIEGRMKIKEYMKIFKGQKVENIILGCTHYPIYDEIIREELEYEVNLINTGKLVAKYMEEFLKKNSMQSDEKNGIKKIFLSKKEDEFQKIAENILSEKIKILEK